MLAGPNSAAKVAKGIKATMKIAVIRRPNISPGPTLNGAENVIVSATVNSTNREKPPRDQCHSRDQIYRAPKEAISAHAARQKAPDRNAERALDRPHHGASGTIGFRDHGVVGHSDPFAVNAD